MDSGEVIHRLIETARMRIRAGEITERKLAGMCGLSQPHMHNVLKNFRSLSPESADRLMAALDLNVPALIFRCHGKGDSEVRMIPVVRNRIGPGTDPILTNFRGYMPFSAGTVASLIDPVIAQVAPDLVLPKPLAALDFVLLDQNPVIRAEPAGGGCWVVVDSNGLRIRYVKRGGTKIYFANEITLHNPPEWQPVALNGREIMELVKARIVWSCRDIDPPAVPPAVPNAPPN